MMKENVDTAANSFVEKFRVGLLFWPEMFFEKLVESLMLKRRQFSLHQNLSNRLTNDART